MIKVEIFKEKSNLIRRYSICGHANYRSSGEDIICSAVSILGYTVLRSLVEVCGIVENKITYKIDEEIGLLDVTIPSDLNEDIIEKTQIVFNTFEVGIKSLVESYPKYISLKYRGGVMND